LETQVSFRKELFKANLKVLESLVFSFNSLTNVFNLYMTWLLEWSLELEWLLLMENKLSCKYGTLLVCLGFF